MSRGGETPGSADLRKDRDQFERVKKLGIGKP
jgi:hypothetical protein